MIFLLKDSAKDLTLKIITEPDYYINILESILSEDIEYNERYPFFSGMTKGTSGEYNLHAYMFDLYKVAACVAACKTSIKKVSFFCFDYQKEYIQSILEIDENIAERIDIITISNKEEGKW